MVFSRLLEGEKPRRRAQRTTSGFPELKAASEIVSRLIGSTNPPPSRNNGKIESSMFPVTSCRLKAVHNISLSRFQMNSTWRPSIEQRLKQKSANAIVQPI